MIFCAVIAGIFTLLFAVALGCAAKDYEQFSSAWRNKTQGKKPQSQSGYALGRNETEIEAGLCRVQFSAALTLSQLLVLNLTKGK